MPKSRSANEAAGNPGRRPGSVGPAGLPGQPACPSIVEADPLAAAAWGQVCSDLESLGLLSRTDGPVIARYCLTWSRYQGVAEMLAKLGGQAVSVSKKTGQPYITAFATAEQMLSSRMDKLESELGLTPLARARLGLVVPAEDSKQDKFNIVG